MNHLLRSSVLVLAVTVMASVASAGLPLPPAPPGLPAPPPPPGLLLPPPPPGVVVVAPGAPPAPRKPYRHYKKKHGHRYEYKHGKRRH